MPESELLSRDRLLKAFKLFDKDSSGSITIEELREVFAMFNSAGSDMDDDYIGSIISQVDANGDGDVSFDEFVAMMTGDH